MFLNTQSMDGMAGARLSPSVLAANVNPQPASGGIGDFIRSGRGGFWDFLQSLVRPGSHPMPVQQGMPGAQPQAPIPPAPVSNIMPAANPGQPAQMLPQMPAMPIPQAMMAPQGGANMWQGAPQIRNPAYAQMPLPTAAPFPAASALADQGGFRPPNVQRPLQGANGLAKAAAGVQGWR